MQPLPEGTRQTDPSTTSTVGRDVVPAFVESVGLPHAQGSLCEHNVEAPPFTKSLLRVLRL